MKTNVILLLILLIGTSVFAQNKKYEVPARQTPVFKKENLNKAVYVNDLTPLLWASMEIKSDERYFLDQRRVNEFPQPPGYQYPQDKYKQILDIVSVEITGNSNGKFTSAQNNNDKLTAEQKNLLAAAVLGTQLTVKIKYKYKDQTKDSFGARNKTIEGKAEVMVVPDTEAEFPGGLKQFSNYINSNVIEKTNNPKATDILFFAIVSFTVDENGQIINAGLSRATENTQINSLLLDALKKMPAWKPAQNADGVKVKQHFVIPFGVGC